MAYAITTCDTAANFSKFREPWNELLERSQFPTPHWRHAWVTSWLNSYWNDKPLCFIMVWDEKTLVAAAPLIRDSTRFYRIEVARLRFASSSVTTTNLFIVDKNHFDSVRPLLSYISSLKNSWTLGEFIEIPNSIADHICSLISEQSMSLRSLRRPARTSPYLPLKGSYETYFESQSKSFRYDVRRCKRNIQKAGSISIQRFDDPQSVSKNLNIAFEVSGMSWKEASRMDMAGNEKSRAFYESLCQSTDTQCRPLLWILSLDEKAIAIQFYIADRKTIHLLRSDFDESYSRLRPGVHLQNEVVRDCYSMSFEELNFGGMDDSYKTRYTKYIRCNYHVDLFNSRTSSRLIYALKSAKRSAKILLTSKR